ncbi:MAG: hypothetical protein KHX30_01250 [Clostridium sp.]|nr:hypothetical protein [Clostridium sp.]
MISDRYYYNDFPIAQQVIYKKMYDAIIRQDEYIICGERDYRKEDFQKILSAVIIDNPDLYFAKNTFSAERTSWGLIKIYPQYYFEKKDKAQIVSELEKNVYRLFDSVNIGNKDQEEIIKSVHDYLILKNHPEIRDDELEKCAIVETLLENKLTAQGAAYTYKYLLNSAGIQCNVICGSFHGIEGSENIQTWNCVKMYGEDRYIDLFEDAIGSSEQKICYEYFGVTDETILKDHSIKVSLLPEAEKKIDVTIKKEEIQDKTNLEKNKPDDVFHLISFNSLSIDEILENLKKVPPELQSDNVWSLIENLIQKLKDLHDIEKQYATEKEQLEKGIIDHFPDLFRILQEYYRYKRYSASSNLIEMLYEKLNAVADTLIKAMQYNINLFWNEHTNEVISEISGIQQNLLNEKKNRKPCPIDVSSLNEDSDINEFILVLDYLRVFSLPQKINEQIIRILDNLKRLQDAISRNSDKATWISSFKNYYLPEAIRLIILYDKYEDEGISERRLKDLYENIDKSLDAVNNAINAKLDEIYVFETMETKARAQALADVIGQDGYVTYGNFKK